jgi:hypothetical protein
VRSGGPRSLVVREALALLGAAVPILLPACGSNVAISPGASPVSPVPGPTATAPPSALAYVLDRGAGAVLVFEASDATGELRLVARQDVPEPRVLAVDPFGRFLYVAGGGTVWSGGGEEPPYVRCYATDPGSGQLTERSFSHANPFGCPWTALAANEGQVYAVAATCMTGYHGGWFLLDVAATTGALTPAPTPPVRWEPAFVVADPQGRFVYSGAVERQSCSYCAWLYISTVQGGGTIDDTGGVKVAPSDVGPLSGAVLGEGILYVADPRARILSFDVSAGLGRPPLLARLDSAFEGSGARLAFGRSTTPRLPTAAASSHGAWLAVSTRAGLGLFEALASGELSLRDEASSPALASRSVAFHPSGRFLYASGVGEGVRVFAVDDGRLREVGQEPLGDGAIAVMAR